MQINEVSGKIGGISSSQNSLMYKDNQRLPPQKLQQVDKISDFQHNWSEEELKGIVETLQDSLNQLQKRIVFSINKDTHEVVVKVIDPKTNKVIRQIPPEELLKVREKLNELIGILFEARA